MLSNRVRAILGICASCLLTACGGSETEPPVHDPGTLEISVRNLPAALAAPLSVSGPDTNRSIAGAATLTGLAPGRYVVRAFNVIENTQVWTPAVAELAIDVEGSASTPVIVNYTAQPLALAVREVAKLPGAVFLSAPEGDQRLFIVERSGQIFIMDQGALLPEPFLDIRARVSSIGEGGLLSLAFDPNYAFNGYFYIYYTDLNNNIVLERRQRGLRPDRADPGQALAIIRIAHPFFNNHFGGLVSFGPDGYLYLATGDGGGAGDPQNNAQNRFSLLGKVLRLDVSGATALRPYAIPPSNPFQNPSNGLAEIWALGLRNPWRYAFDADRLFIADVGQARREEINIADVDTPGLNYGWDITEGSLCFGADSCDKQGLTLPAHTYERTDEQCAIVGGAVYRGAALAHLEGRYLYSDVCAGFLRSILQTDAGIVERLDWPIGDIGGVVSFGQDAAGEFYLLAADGKIYQLVASGS